MQIRPVLIPIAAALLLTGCGSSTSASKSNFAKAINTALAKNCIAVSPHSMSNALAVNGSKYPVTVKETKATGNGFLGISEKAAKDANARAFGPFDALVKAGLLTSTSGQIKPRLGPAGPGKTYSLTATGKKALKDKNGTTFCAGHWQVKEITNFTEPGKAIDGATRSTVQFTYAAADVPKWTQAAIEAGYPNLKQEIGTPGKGRADLVLTNNGWEAQVDTLNAQ